jgi:hypothetical protein
LIYNNKGEIENGAREASDEELKYNPEGLDYDRRTRDALEGRDVKPRDTRSKTASITGNNANDSQGTGAEQSGSIRDTDTGRTEGLTTLPPKDKPLTLIFGGSYSPLHTGHIDAAFAAVKHAESQGYTVERIILAPVADSLLQTKTERKGKPEEFIPIEHRAEIARLLVKELDAKGVKNLNHELFEKWRNKTAQEISDSFAEYSKDVAESYNRYQAAFDVAAARMGFKDEAEAAASWAKVVALLESKSGSRESLSSSAEGIERDQSPDESRIKPTGLPSASDQTNTRPLSPTETLGSVKNGIISPSKTNVTQPERGENIIYNRFGLNGECQFPNTTD